MLRSLALVWLIGAVALAVWANPPPRPIPPRQPFFDRRTRELQYPGPGREQPEPEDVREVLIGYFGPSDPAHPEGDLWCAAQLALQQSNRQGGYRGKPFRLIPRWSDSPWTAGAAHVAQMVYGDQVWAVLAGIDGPTAHLAEQVVVKARVPLVATATTDRTTHSAIVPWMFSILPGDQLQAPVLAQQIARSLGPEGFIVLSTPDHDARCFWGELNRALARQRLAPRYHFTCQPADEDLSGIVLRAARAAPSAAVVLAEAGASARLVLELRKAGFSGRVFGGPWMARRRFLDQAGPAAERVVFPLVVDPRAEATEFQKAFQKRCGGPPDYAAAATYDAVRLLVAAIQKAGLNRARIGDALRELSGWQGATGRIAWDPLGGNTRPVALGTIRAGRVVPLASQ